MRYPLVKQSGIKDCAPCCLASIIIYYKGYVSVEVLSEMMNTTKNGTTAYDLIETAKKIGFDSKGMKVNLGDLCQLNFPLIAHVTISNVYEHFIIIYKIDYEKKLVIIGDPADKIKRMNFTEFSQIWNNIVIILMPLKPIPLKKHKSLIQFVSNVLKQNRKKLLKIILISNIFLIISGLYSILIKYILDNINNISSKIVIFFILIYSIKILILYVKNVLTIKLSKNISLNLTNEVIKYLILLPYPYYRNHTTGELISRFNDIQKIKITLNDFILVLLDVPLFILFISIIFYINYIIGLLVILIVILFILSNLLLTKKLYNYSCQYRDKCALFSSFLTENINGFETVKGLNKEDYIILKLNEKYMAQEEVVYKYKLFESIHNIVIDFITNIGSILVIIISFLLCKNNNITIGSVFIIYTAYSSLIEPLNNIMLLYFDYKESSNVSNRIQDFNFKIDKKIIKPDKYDINYKNVNYKIGLKTILANINLTIKHGEKVFITGVSGSGKSTLVKLIKGYLKTDNIFIGKKNISDVNLDKVLYISQNDIIYNDTLYGNLLTNCEDDINDIIKTCEITQNLNYNIEENGFNISGGEKERIVLARTLLLDFEILIIDEGLQEIDIEKERKILINMFEKYKDKTIIVISHRLDNMDLFNHLIQMQDGKIIGNNLK